MKLEKIIHETIKICEDYLKGNISGDDFDLKYDELLADEYPTISDSPFYELLENYQQEFALYVCDEEQRKDYHGYFCDVELRKKVETFLTELKAFPLGN